MGMFSGNKKLETATAKKKSTRKEFEIEGVRELAILDAFIDSANTMKATIEADVKNKGFSKFQELTGGARVTSIVGIEHGARTTIEMRKRSSRSVLTPEEVEILKKNKFDVGEQVITPQLFAVNPAYMNDMELLKRVEKALTRIVPEDFFLVQEEVKANIVTDENLDDAFQRGTTDEVMSILTSMAVKPALTEDYDVRNLQADAMEIMFPKPKIEAAKPARKVAAKKA